MTGKAERGKLKVGQEVEIIGYNRSAKSKVTGIEMFHKTLEEANAGDQMGVLIRGLKRDDVRRGMVVVKPGSIKQQDHVQAQIYVMTKDEGGLAQPIVNEQQLTLFSKTWDAPALIKLASGKEMIMPGEDGSIQVQLPKPMVLEKNQHFTLRGGGSTIGTGKVSAVGNYSKFWESNWFTKHHFTRSRRSRIPSAKWRRSTSTPARSGRRR